MIDLQYLRHVSDHNQDFINQMVIGFLDCAPGLIEDMYRYFEIESWDQLAHSAHKLKPSAEYMGIPGLPGLIEQLESEIKQSRPQKYNIRECLDTIKITCQQAYPALKSEIS